jgi:uncharacterized protein (DUF58 family)
MPEATLRRLGLTLRRRLLGRLPGDQPTRGTAADGMELSQLRPYVPGDDVRRIDPAASARTGEPHVRRLVPERAVTTWIVVDVSPSMAFGTTTRLKSDVAEGAAEVVTRLAARHGGSVALMLAAGDHAPVLPPQGGRTALAAIRGLLQGGVLADGAAADLGRSLDRVARLTRSAGIVVVISDFRDEGWEVPLRRLAARHSVLAIDIRDPMEDALPDAGTVTFVDPESGELVDLDTADRGLRELLARAESERRGRVAAVLRSAGAQHVQLRTDDDWLRELGRSLSDRLAGSLRERRGGGRA